MAAQGRNEFRDRALWTRRDLDVCSGHLRCHGFDLRERALNDREIAVEPNDGIGVGRRKPAMPEILV